ncbi:MAG: alkaline shock response membrane anchor protein AmaP [Anaerolineae bacterium]|jgi:hypothetical protein
MNTFNRVMVVVVVLLAIPIGTAVFVAPIPILGAVGGWMIQVADSLDPVDWYVRLSLGILAALIWLALCISVLVLELRRRQPRTVRLQKVGGGEVEVSLKTVSERIAYDVSQLPNVLRTRPRVSAKRGGVVVKVNVDLKGDSPVPARASQIVETVRRAVEERVGIKLTTPPKVTVHAAPAPPKPEATPPPRPEAPPPEPTVAEE